MNKVPMKRPVMLGVALTNRPHIRLRNHPITVIDDNKIRVPFMVLGRYGHPNGELDVTEDVAQLMIKNQKDRVADFDLGLDAKHKPELGSWAWFEENLGGDVVLEKDEKTGDRLLVGYAVSTSEVAIDMLKKGVYRYASLEFHPNYRSNVKQTYLSSDLEDLEGDNMEITQEMYDGVVEARDKLQSELDALKAKVDELNQSVTTVTAAKAELESKNTTMAEQIASLREQAKNTEPELTPRELEMQNRILQLEEKGVRDEVRLAIAKAATRSDDGYGFNAVALNLLSSIMTGEPVDEGRITLTSISDASAIATYFRSALTHYLKTAPLAPVKLEGKTAPDTTVNLEESSKNDSYEQGRADGKSFWGGN